MLLSRSQVQGARSGAPAECMSCGMYELAWAYDLAGQADSAVAILQRAVTATGSRTVRADAEWRGRALQRLAQLTRVRGDTAAARGHHNALIHLYRDADASVQERMRASL